jgi:hypothetical protein
MDTFLSQSRPVFISKTWVSKGSHLLLWAGSKATHEKIMSGTHNCLNYCEIFIVHEHTPFTNVASGHIIELGRQLLAHGPHVEDPYFKR